MGWRLGTVRRAIECMTVCGAAAEWVSWAPTTRRTLLERAVFAALVGTTLRAKADSAGMGTSAGCVRMRMDGEVAAGTLHGLTGDRWLTAAVQEAASAGSSVDAAAAGRVM